MTRGGEGHLPTQPPQPQQKKKLTSFGITFRTVFTCLRLAAFREIAIKNWAYYMWKECSLHISISKRGEIQRLEASFSFYGWHCQQLTM